MIKPTTESLCIFHIQYDGHRNRIYIECSCGGRRHNYATKTRQAGRPCQWAVYVL